MIIWIEELMAGMKRSWLKASLTALLGVASISATTSDAQQKPLYSNASPSYAARQRVTLTVVKYLAAWNERDPQRRRAMIAEVFVTDGSYMDPNRHGVGYQEIDSLISSAQQAYPGYTLRLTSTIDLHHESYVRFSWASGGTPETPVYLAGTDFVKLAGDGRIQSVVGFGDAAAVALPVDSKLDKGTSP